MEVSGFRLGISVGTFNNLAGWKDVSLTRNHVHDNIRAGIQVQGVTVGQERWNGLTTGLDVDPGLSSASSLLAAGNRLLPTSPLRNAGMDIQALGIPLEKRDYFGPLPSRDAAFDIGFHEFQ